MKTQAIQWLRGIVTVGLSVVGVLFGGTSALATIIAQDNADDPAYATWDPGDNGGFGFGGGWTFRNQSNVVLTSTNSQRGWFAADSRGNNNPAGAGGDSNGDFDINTPASAAGKAWGLYSNGTTLDQVYAIRPFNGDLLVGDTVSWYMDNGNITSTQVVGLRFLSNPADITSRVFEVRFVGGDSEYSTVGNPNQTLTSIGFTREGLKIDYTLTSATTFSLTVSRLQNNGTVIQTITGNNVAGAGPIRALAFKNQFAGTGATNDAYLNSLTVVRTIPEASAIWLCGLTICYLLCPSRCRAE